MLPRGTGCGVQGVAYRVWGTGCGVQGGWSRMVAVPDGAVPVVAVDFGQSLFRPKHFFEFGQF